MPPTRSSKAATSHDETPSSHKIHQCPHCDYQTKRTNDFKRHVERHDDSKAFKPEMKIHKLKHVVQLRQLAVQMFALSPGCDFAAKDPSSLHRHRRTKHGYEPNAGKAPKAPRKRSPQPRSTHIPVSVARIMEGSDHSQFSNFRSSAPGPSDVSSQADSPYVSSPVDSPYDSADLPELTDSEDGSDSERSTTRTGTPYSPSSPAPTSEVPVFFVTTPQDYPSPSKAWNDTRTNTPSKYNFFLHEPKTAVEPLHAASQVPTDGTNVWQTDLIKLIGLSPTPFLASPSSESFASSPPPACSPSPYSSDTGSDNSSQSPSPLASPILSTLQFPQIPQYAFPSQYGFDTTGAAHGLGLNPSPYDQVSPHGLPSHYELDTTSFAHGVKQEEYNASFGSGFQGDELTYPPDEMCWPYDVIHFPSDLSATLDPNNVDVVNGEYGQEGLGLQFNYFNNEDVYASGASANVKAPSSFGGHFPPNEYSF
ncbi:hypothetical protein CPB84DRAFT_1767436 [Gymnopilus junonius]|uniref:C2H2-type domain-containing protein n=1 Tax=Gymnopilus junonius TaxID=109634 RepID=A0A9P5NTM7_GYMJU|nr:hypothetical protein CPB84DRAFT_1767436 [Gymnopilus junonius]